MRWWRGNRDGWGREGVRGGVGMVMRERMRRREKRVVDRRMYGDGMAATAEVGWWCIVGSDSCFVKALNFRTLLL